MMNNIRYRLEIIKEIFPYTKGTRKFFLMLCLCNLLSMVIVLANPLFFRMLIDDVIIGKKLSPLFIVAAGYLSIYAGGLLLDILNTHWSNKLINQSLLKIRSKIFNNYLEMDFEQYNKYAIGDLKMRLDEDADKLSIFAQSQTSQRVVSIVTIIITLTALFRMSLLLALFSMIIVPITFYLGHVVSKVEGRLLEERRKITAANDSWLHSSLSGWKEIKALNLQKNQFRTYVSNIHKIALNNSKWIMMWTLRVLVIPMFKDEFLMQFSLYFVGGILVMKGHFTIGTLLVFMRYYGIFYSNINKVNNSNVELKENKPSFDRILGVLDVEKNTNYRTMEALRGKITLKNAGAKYNGQIEDAIRGVSFEIKRGEKIAIVGKSGAGKTTILKLLLGMLKVPGGMVFFDDNDINEIPPLVLYKNMGVVMQDSILFNMSIRDNLRLVKPDCTDKDLDEACHNAGVKDFIDSLPLKYHTIIGERGLKLSGGQRQRIAIARVFLRQPDIVIFDEATSALDVESENVIHKSISQLGKDKTVIVVAHRLSSILSCDRVIVIKEGRIVAMGTHGQLLQNSEEYGELFREQYLTA